VGESHPWTIEAEFVSICSVQQVIMPVHHSERSLIDFQCLETDNDWPPVLAGGRSLYKEADARRSWLSKRGWRLPRGSVPVSGQLNTPVRRRRSPGNLPVCTRFASHNAGRRYRPVPPRRGFVAYGFGRGIVTPAQATARTFSIRPEGVRLNCPALPHWSRRRPRG
jgi:hypothetical protein